MEDQEIRLAVQRVRTNRLRSLASELRNTQDQQKYHAARYPTVPLQSQYQPTWGLPVPTVLDDAIARRQVRMAAKRLEQAQTRHRFQMEEMRNLMVNNEAQSGQNLKNRPITTKANSGEQQTRDVQDIHARLDAMERELRRWSENKVEGKKGASEVEREQEAVTQRAEQEQESSQECQTQQIPQTGVGIQDGPEVAMNVSTKQDETFRDNSGLETGGGEADLMKNHVDVGAAKTRANESMQNDIQDLLRDDWLQKEIVPEADVSENSSDGGSHAGETVEDRRRRREEKMRELKKRANETNTNLLSVKMKWPRHRWRMAGVDVKKVDESLVLKGPSLVRACVIYPLLFAHLIRKEAEATKDKQTAVCRQDLEELNESSAQWLVRTLRTPLGSILKDRELNFNLRSLIPDQRHKNYMQMIVRVKAVVKDLTSAELPPRIVRNLYSLMRDKGHKNTNRTYYPDNFLFKCERDALELSGFGANLNIFESGDDDSAAIHQWPPPPSPPPKRVRILITTFLLVRILAGGVLLKPWKYGLGNRPSSQTRKAIERNLRVVATVFLGILRKVLPILDTLGSHEMAVIDEEEEAEEDALTKNLVAKFKAYLFSSSTADGSDAGSLAGEEERQAGQMAKDTLALFPTEHELQHDLMLPDEYFSRVVSKIEEVEIECANNVTDWITKTAGAVVRERDERIEPMSWTAQDTLAGWELSDERISFILSAARPDAMPAAIKALKEGSGDKERGKLDKENKVPSETKMD